MTPLWAKAPWSEAINESGLQVVRGTGPLGLAVARHLAGKGHRVRAANRAGRADLPSRVEVVSANVAVAAEATRACDGGAVVYHMRRFVQMALSRSATLLAFERLRAGGSRWPPCSIQRYVL
jgi:uncharacterized protein YbjT (DUF2867 family)